VLDAEKVFIDAQNRALEVLAKEGGAITCDEGIWFINGNRPMIKLNGHPSKQMEKPKEDAPFLKVIKNVLPINGSSLDKQEKILDDSNHSKE
jgi:hypothetical protein